jgi:hypothetical protein
MKYSFCLLMVLGLTMVPSVFGDDQQKVEKQLNRISAMAADATGHRIVSATMADMLQVKRPELVQQRLKMNLSYGSLFLAHQLVAGGANLDDIASGIQGGKSLSQIANERNADWKQILEVAKKLNGKIEEHVYSHFIDDKSDKARDEADHYEPFADMVKADNDGECRRSGCSARRVRPLARTGGQKGGAAGLPLGNCRRAGRPPRTRSLQDRCAGR